MLQASFSRKLFVGFVGVILVAVLVAAVVALAGLEAELGTVLGIGANAGTSRAVSLLVFRRLLAATGAGLLAALVLGFLLARRFAAPLGRLATGAEDLAAGRAEASLPATAGGEVGRLARAVRQLDDSARASTETLRTDRNRLGAVLAGMVEGVVAVDREERVVHLNQSAARILRCPAGEMAGRRVWELTRIRAVSEALGAAMAQSQEVTREARVVEGSREQILQLHAAPLSTGMGDSAGAVVVLHDITHQRRLEEARREFVANVSHELKTPLTAITALVETILDDDQMASSMRERFLTKVRGQCARLTDMVRDLLDLSRLEAGDIRSEFQLLDLRRAIRQAVNGLEEAAASRDVEMTLNLPPDAVQIMGDERALARMLGNLLENAIKYTGGGGRVVVGAAITEGEVVIEVQDDGPGIDERHHGRVFERFYRVDTGRSRDVGGTGLGLSIVKHVALAHGGRVGLRSAPGEGSTFQVVLPQAILEPRAG